MITRDALADLLRLDDERFRDRVPRELDEEEYDADRLDRLDDADDADDAVDADDGDVVDPALDPPIASESLADHEAAYVRRIRVLDEASIGITFTGPAYADNPLVYANRTFRESTGYPLTDLRGENLRLLQGPDTDPDAVADLREALSTWSRATAELTNYRADGTPFRNRVSLVPVTDAAGSVVNWLGFQQAVDERSG